MPSPKMLSMKAAADELGVSRATLSGTLKVRQADLDEYLADATSAGAAE
jgi:DNA transposition AAA+ family ATPase